MDCYVPFDGAKGDIEEGIALVSDFGENMAGAWPPQESPLEIKTEIIDRHPKADALEWRLFCALSELTAIRDVVQ